MSTILFVCSANRFRSVIAAACFRFLLSKNHLGEGWKVESAGTWAVEGLPPVEPAITFVNSKGLNIGDNRSREVNSTLLEGADLVLVMSKSQKEAIQFEFPHVKERVHLLTEVCQGSDYDIPDLMENRDETPEELANEVWNLVYNGFGNICVRLREHGTAHPSSDKDVGD